MNLNQELIAKAKEVKSVEELSALLKEYGIEITEEDAKALFDAFSSDGELTDDELGAVAGGKAFMLGPWQEWETHDVTPFTRCRVNCFQPNWEANSLYINNSLCMACVHFKPNQTDPWGICEVDNDTIQSKWAEYLQTLARGG